MASYSDLVDVQFIDATVHEETPTRGDVLGIYMPFFWGPSRQKLVLDKSAFFGYYPESLPPGVAFSKFNAHFFEAYAQVKKFFENGGDQVEVYRPQPWYVDGSVLRDKIHCLKWVVDVNTDIYIHLKYTGFPGSADLPNLTQYLELSAEKLGKNAAGTEQYKFKLAGRGVGVNSVIEEFTCQLVDEVQQIDGQYTHITKVIKNTRFLDAVVSTDPTIDTNDYDAVAHTSTAGAPYLFKDVRFYPIAPSSVPSGVTAISTLDKFVAFDVAGESTSGYQIKEVVQTELNELYSGIDTSDASLIVPPVYKSPVYNTTLLEACTSSKMRQLVFGVDPKNDFLNTPEGQNPNYWPDTQTTLSDAPKFAMPVLGKELVYLFGFKMLCNCAGGVAGAYANIAKSVRMNQPASAQTYGKYAGVLLDTKKFDEVLSMHDNGIINIYKSAKGPQIFGIHNPAYKKNPSSYFANINVMRVTCDVLRQVMPMAADAIHTDTALNDSNRLLFENKLNNVISTHVAAQNLQPDSQAYCNAAMNTEISTNKGKILNVLLKMHYIGLVEKVSIRIVATDSTVTAEIV